VSVTEIVMPQLGLTMEAGKVLQVLKAVGEFVEKGELLFELETEKTTVVIEAPATGFLRVIKAKPNESYPVGTVIAYLTDSPDEPLPER